MTTFDIMIYICFTDANDRSHVICNDPKYKPTKILAHSSVISWAYGELMNGTKIFAFTTMDNKTLVNLFTLDGLLAATLDIKFNILYLNILDDQLFVVSDNNQVFIYGYISSF